MLYWEPMGKQSKRIPPALIIGVALLTGIAPVCPRAVDLPRGKVLTEITCRDAPGETYALYLPTDFHPDKELPLLLTLDPGGRTTLTVTRFQSAAEEFSWIIACPAGARNGPWEPVFRAVRAVWTDLNSRFPLDPDRIYTAGFSGGARAAALVPRLLNHRIRGIIACGAGLPAGMDPSALDSDFYLGVIGLYDFNYRELYLLEGDLKKSGIDHFITRISLDHRWPSPEICFRLIAWLQIKDDPDYAGPWEQVYRKSVPMVKEPVEWGMAFQAAAGCRFLAGIFDPLTGEDSLLQLARRIESNPEFRSSLKEEDHRIKREINLLKNYMSVLKGIHQIQPPFRGEDIIWDKIRLATVLGCRDSHSIPLKSLGVRLLSEFVNRARTEALRCLREEKYEHALLFYSILQKCGEPGYRDFYHRAAASARLGRTGDAVRHLTEAIARGFHDPEQLADDPDFKMLRSTAGFQKLLKGLQDNQ